MKNRPIQTVAARVDSIVTRELGMRVGGRGSSDEDLIRRHADLMPDLAAELRIIGRIATAFRTAGPGSETYSVEPLSFDDLEAPICDDEVLPPPTVQVTGYRVLRKIGAGGQAIVYSAVQLSTGRTVALKVLRGGASPDQRHLTRLDRETRILAGLDHPSITSIIDRGRTVDGSFFLSMPLIEGIALDAFWRKEFVEGSRDIRRVLDVFIALADALQEAHRRDIVHRDMKPSNVLVDCRTVPHVLDFGLAHESAATPEISIAGQMIGSLPWASPEQVTGREATSRSDVYALGVMLYEALTGRPPYPTDGPVPATLRNILTSAPEPPRKVVDSQRRTWGSGLDAAVLRSLSKDPVARPASAGAFAEELRLFLANPQLKDRTSERRTRLALAGGAMLLVVMVPLCVCGVRQPLAPPPVALPRFTNSLQMELLLIPAGACTVGSGPHDPHRGLLTQQRNVTIQPFFLGSTEVTEAQWSLVMGGPGRTNLPKVNVSWAEATQFCERLGQLEHRHYRLPTSDEWEYAAKSGAAHAPFGLSTDGGEAAVDDVAWSAATGKSRLQAVATKNPTYWGLYDMAGNAAEWCADTVDSSSFAPHDMAVQKIIRGGSAWDSSPNLTLSTCEVVLAEPGTPRIGLRVACDKLHSP